MNDLDPERVEQAAMSLSARRGSQVVWVEDSSRTETVLAADDARAREAGLVATGDGLTLEWVRIALGIAHTWSTEYVALLAALPVDLRARIEGGEQRG